VHPTQVYSSMGAVVFGSILLLVLRRSQRAEAAGRYRFLTRPGSTFSLMFVLYGVMRFGVEFLRDDNPFEMASLTISQLLSLGVVALGFGLIAFFALARPEKLPGSKKQAAPSRGGHMPVTRD